MKLKIATILISMAVGFALALLFNEPEVVRRVVVQTKERIDTVYNVRIDTLILPEPVLVERVDTVYYSEPHKADVSVYSGSERLDYGTIDWKAETTGKMINFSMIPNLQLPTIIKEIETTKTITDTRDLRGVYAGASVSDQLSYKLGASYVDRSWQFNADYQLKERIIWVGLKKRVFGF